MCSDYLKPCNTCQPVPSPPSSEQGTRTGPDATLSINLHHVGEHFIEAITEVEQDSIVEGEDLDRTEDSDQLLQGIQFKATIRGWSHRAQQHRATTLPSLRNEPMVKRIQENQDLVLLPTTWWSLTMGTLEPNELGYGIRSLTPFVSKNVRHVREE